ITIGEPDNRVRTVSTRYLTANSTLPPQAAPFGRCWRRSFRLRCQALAEHAAPNARIRAPTAGRLRFAFLSSPLVHGSPIKGYLRWRGLRCALIRRSWAGTYGTRIDGLRQAP